MPDSTRPLAVVPADYPQQIAGSPHLERLSEFADIQLYPDAPGSVAQQLERAADCRGEGRDHGQGDHDKWPGHIVP